MAVEVRSRHDYGSTADREYEAKRADYFAVGTQVVWDADPVKRTITSYRADRPDEPIQFHLGEYADAEPTLPGWRVAVTDLFR